MDKWSEGTVVEVLRTRYKSPEYALLPQVRNSTGFARTVRTADAIAMSLWPSRGLTLSGFEIKTYRGDWLSELRNPEKSAEIQQYCDEWWIVVPHETPQIATVEEIPANWGLMEVQKGGRTKVLKQAPPLQPIPITKEFLAAIFRGIDKYEAPLDAIEAARRRGVEEGKKSEKESNEYLLRGVRMERDRLKKESEDFQRTSGLSIHYCGGERVGRALRLFMDKGEVDRVGNSLKNLLITSRSIADGIESSLKEIEDATRNQEHLD